MDLLAQTFEELGLRSGVQVGGLEIDFASEGHDVIVEVKRGQGGARDIHAAALRLAMLVRELAPRKAVLLVDGVRMSAEGLRAAWRSVQDVLAPEVARAMCLVALLDEELVSIPEDDPYLKRLGERARAALGTRTREQRVDRSFEVMRLLLSRWLQRKGRMAVGDIQRQTGLSHPSVSKALDALGPAIERRRDRSVILATFPTEAWNRLLALAPQVRQTRALNKTASR